MKPVPMPIYPVYPEEEEHHTDETHQLRGERMTFENILLVAVSAIVINNTIIAIAKMFLNRQGRRGAGR